MKNIAIIDDDLTYVELIKEFFSIQMKDIALHHFMDSKNFLLYIENEDFLFDLILLDNHMIGEYGIEYILPIKSYTNSPIIILSSDSEISARVLKLGAYAYLDKNVDVEYVYLQICSFLNVNYNIEISFNDSSYEIVINQKLIRLNPKEYCILKFLHQNRNESYSQKDIINFIYGDDYSISNRVVDTYIATIRRKVNKNIILTIPKKGYKFNEDFETR